jgi:putative oxidoreductase
MTPSDREEMHLHLWVAQWALAATFHLLGLVKAFVPALDLQQGLNLLVQAPAMVLRPVGLVELVGSLGLVLPAATGILPRLTPLAAGCLAGVAVLGAIMPGTAAGLGLPLPNLLLGLGAAWVAWGRTTRVPIAPLGLREAAREDAVRHAAGHFQGGRPARGQPSGSTRRGAAA